MWKSSFPHSSTRGRTLRGPGSIRDGNGISTWTPQGPGQCLALVTRGWRHSWLDQACLLAPSGPYGNPSFPSGCFCVCTVSAIENYPCPTHQQCGHDHVPRFNSADMTMSHTSTVRTWSCPHCWQLSKFSALSSVGFEPGPFTKCWHVAGTLPTELLRIVKNMRIFRLYKPWSEKIFHQIMKYVQFNFDFAC